MNYQATYNDKVASLAGGLARFSLNRIVNAPTAGKAFRRSSNAMKMLKYLMAAKRVAPDAKADLKDMTTNTVDPTVSLE